MEEPLSIIPFTKPVAGEVRLPGSKSITNRALILAALASGATTLRGTLFSEDTVTMIEALRALGFSVDVNAGDCRVTVKGLGGEIPNAMAMLNVGNAGTAARFLTAFLCLHPEGIYHLDGSAAMRKRPMRGLLDAIEALNAATVSYGGEAGYFPFTLDTHGLSGGRVSVDASASSQMLSALLMVAPLAKGPLTIELSGQTVSLPFVSMTLQMMQEFGQPAVGDVSPFAFNPKPYKSSTSDYFVEPDATAASYFLALVWVAGGRLVLTGLTGGGLKQGDAAFADVISGLGLAINKTDTCWEVQRVDSSAKGLNVDFNAISDTFLTLAAMAPLLGGPTHIRGIGHTRHQETDRIAAMAWELEKLGQRVTQEADSLYIEPRPLQPAAVDTYEDHRVAMSFGILGCYDLRKDGAPWLRIYNPFCCSKTFPNFFNVLKKLRR